MPVFDFICREDKIIIKDIFVTDEEDIPICPECEELMEKIIGAPAVKFIGSGFYVNDYQGKSNLSQRQKTKSNSEIDRELDKEDATGNQQRVRAIDSGKVDYEEIIP